MAKIRVIINGNEVTLYSNWLSSSAWRYIAVTVVKSYYDSSTVGGNAISSSQVNIYLDKVLAASLTVPSFFQDDQSDATKISDTIGRNFRGVIRLVRMQASMFCGASMSPSVTTSKICRFNP